MVKSRRSQLKCHKLKVSNQNVTTKYDHKQYLNLDILNVILQKNMYIQEQNGLPRQVFTKSEVAIDVWIRRQR